MAGMDWNDTNLPWQNTALPWKNTSISWNSTALPWKGGAGSAPAPFVGEGDIVASAQAWWGVVAYNAATTGQRLIRIRRASDNAERDIGSLSTGTLDLASASAFIAGTTGSVVVIYDQTGNGRHVQQTTAAQQPSLNLTGVGALPSIDFASANSHNLISTASVTQAQPLTLSFFVKPNAGSSKGIITNGSGVSGVGLFYDSDAPGTVAAYGGLDLFATATAAQFHSFSAVINGASSDMNIDGAPNTGNAGANTMSSTTIVIGQFAGVQFFQGSITTMGYWAGAFSADQSSQMSVSRHNYWGV